MMNFGSDLTNFESLFRITFSILIIFFSSPIIFPLYENSAIISDYQVLVCSCPIGHAATQIPQTLASIDNLDSAEFSTLIAAFLCIEKLIPFNGNIPHLSICCFCRTYFNTNLTGSATAYIDRFGFRNDWILQQD